jgi:hypothetical protein
MEDSTESGKKNVFSDLSQVEKSLAEDIGAERAQAMVDYFENVRKSSEEMLEEPLSDTDRQLVNQLIQGFQAAQRIVRHVWEKLHATSFPA